MKSLFARLMALSERAKEIVEIAAKTEDWHVAYDLVFSESLSKLAYSIIRELGLQFDYYDPDTTYEEDVCAYVNALSGFIREKQAFFQ